MHAAKTIEGWSYGTALDRPIVHQQLLDTIAATVKRVILCYSLRLDHGSHNRVRIRWFHVNDGSIDGMSLCTSHICAETIIFWIGLILCDPTQKHVVGHMSSVHNDDLGSKYSQWEDVKKGEGFWHDQFLEGGALLCCIATGIVSSSFSSSFRSLPIIVLSDTWISSVYSWNLVRSKTNACFDLSVTMNAVKLSANVYTIPNYCSYVVAYL